MAELAAVVESLGCRDVRTYIQSGNVVFTSGARIGAGLPSALSHAIRERFGFQSVVVVRSARDLAAIVRDNPFVARGLPGENLHVAFLDAAPGSARVARLDPNRSPGDEIVVLGREAYLHLPAGVAGSKLTNAYLDAKLGVTSTLRNWRTVLALLELVRG